jgi:phosphoglycolate phosphatase
VTAPLKAIVFDLDGTIVDTAPDLHDQLQTTLSAWDRDCPPVEEVRAMVGDGARTLIQRGFEATGGWPDGADLDQLYQEFLERYTAAPARLSRPFDGLGPLLDRLDEVGLRLGICTNKPQAPSETLLEELALRHRFPVIVGGDALPVRKPDPSHLTEVLSRLGVAPEETVMVGDSRNDLLTARAAGVPCVLVSFGYTETPAVELGADHVVDRLDELEPALVLLRRWVTRKPEGRV